MQFLTKLLQRLNDPRDRLSGRLIGISLLTLETLLCTGIILRVPYTKIDWDAYMQQITLFRQGERDYSQLIGETGPCVYPAGFIYVFWFLQWATNGGDIFTAQIIFMGIYLATQLVIFELYLRSDKVPPWVLGLVCLSKRLHSIYLLRLFNDCIAMLLAYLGLLALTEAYPRLSVSLFSLAVSVKMNVLLMAPPVFILLLQGATWSILWQSVVLGVLIQIALAVPFLLSAPKAYLIRAFDLSRVFLYEWTVNFKFLPESVFLSKHLAAALLILHVLLLCVCAQYRWCEPTHGLFSTFQRFTQRRRSQMTRLTTDHILFVVFSGNLIGIVCARSLHYQFYCWYFHSLPFLLWSIDSIPSTMKLLMLFSIEICWNIFPSTPLSSLILLCTHLVILALLMLKPKRGRIKGS